MMGWLKKPGAFQNGSVAGERAERERRGNRGSEKGVRGKGKGERLSWERMDFG